MIVVLGMCLVPAAAATTPATTAKSTRAEEAALQRRAAAAGLAPRVLWHSPRGIVTE